MDDPETRGADDLDDIAAFIMHRTDDPGVTDAERLEMYAAVEGYQEGDDPSVIDAALRAIAARYADNPHYRQEWRPSSSPDASA